MALKGVAGATSLSEIKVAYRAGLAADFADGANFDIFQVARGAIQVLMMFGRCTVAFNAAGNSVPFIEITTVVPAATVPLCALIGAINGDAIDSMYAWDGTIAGNLTVTGNLGIIDVGEAAWAGETILLTEGVININNVVANPDGVIDWYVAYLPCTMGAIVIPL